MNLPTIDPTCDMGLRWSETMYAPRMAAWNDALLTVMTGKVRRTPPEIADEFVAERPPEDLPYLGPFGLWVGEAYRGLRDDGPFDQTVTNLRDTFALSKFMRYPRGARHLHLNLLTEPAKSILIGPLPQFLGLTAVRCTLTWDAKNDVIDCIPEKYTDILQFAGDPNTSTGRGEFEQVDLPDVPDVPEGPDERRWPGSDPGRPGGGR